MKGENYLEVKTAWPFPMVQYKAQTSYVEVRRASGISFILLQLINKKENNGEKLALALRNMDVPTDIHYIFAEELANMINLGIVQERGDNYNPEDFGQYSANDFDITEMGRKLFAEGAIPMAGNKVKETNVFYDVSKKETMNVYRGQLYTLADSPMDFNCVGNILLNNSDVENYISSSMNKYSFKKGERITGFEHEEPFFWRFAIEDAATILFGNNSAQIKIDDKDRDAFVHKFYSGEVVTNILDAKKKFRFPENVLKEAEIDTDLSGVSSFCLPSQLSSITSIKTPLSLNNVVLISGSECKIEKEESRDIMLKCNISGIACFFSDEELVSVVPGRFSFDIEGISGPVKVNLIALKTLCKAKKDEVLVELFLRCLDKDEPLSACDVIKKITQISKRRDFLEQFSNSLLRDKKTNAEKIEVFTDLDAEVSGMYLWKEYANTKAEELFNQLCDIVSAGNFKALNVLGKKLNKIMNLKEHDYLARISKKMIDSEGMYLTYELLEEAGVVADVLLGVINVFALYCNDILGGKEFNSKGKLGGQFMMLGKKLNELKRITGINNPYEDSADFEINYDEFINGVASFSECYRKIERFSLYAKEQWSQIAAYDMRFKELKEVLTVEKEANSNPSKINKTYIEQMLKKAKYKDAICDLHVRLQFELNRLFGTDNMSTYDLLEDSRIHTYLKDIELTEMHNLRKCRNGFQHPKENRDFHYTENTISGWCEIVEKIGGMANESRREN